MAFFIHSSQAIPCALYSDLVLRPSKKAYYRMLPVIEIV
jgi:hypothetical protein